MGAFILCILHQRRTTSTHTNHVQLREYNIRKDTLRSSFASRFYACAHAQQTRVKNRDKTKGTYATVAASFLHNEANDEVNDKHMTDKSLVMLLSAPEA